MILAWLVTIMTTLSIVFLAKKYWWAPIFGLVQEFVWVLFIIKTAGTYPLLIGVGAYSVIYAFAIPKWFRERKKR